MDKIDKVLANEFDNLADGSWYQATEVIKARIGWLEHCPEGELTKYHQAVVIAACKAFYQQVQPLVAHYIDGEGLPKRLQEQHTAFNCQACRTAKCKLPYLDNCSRCGFPRSEHLKGTSTCAYVAP